MKKEYLLLGGLAVAAVALLAMKKKTTPAVVQEQPQDNQQGNTPAPTSPVPVALNKNLVLKKGMNGPEVKELQKLLGVTADGIFGSGTEAALMAKKGVKQITLNGYGSAPTINSNALPVGTRVMANRKPNVQVYKNQTSANGQYNRIDEVYTNIPFGKEIGKIIAVSQPSKTQYVVKIDGLLVDALVWVAAADVVKI